ncbi:MAG: ABC transporter permease [Firmicutes bacterium]|nr:ABC transporter permease [Bacillota bacterium]
MKEMLIFILKRLGWSVFVLIGLSILIFCIARIIPGDPGVMALGTRATPEALEQYRIDNFLYESLPRQYIHWFEGAVKGNFGVSTQTRREVALDIKEFLPATLELILFAAILEIVGGILLGALSARYPGEVIDNSVRVASYLGIATPAFVWAIMFMLIFAFVWPILPAIGRIDVPKPPPYTGFLLLDSLLAGNLIAFWDAFKHLIMPGTALALTGVAQAARMTRTSMMENLSKDYVGAEIAAGIPMRRVILQYVLRPAATPTVSIVALDIAAMLGNAFLVEVIFSYPGISKYGINAILNKDLNAIVAVVLVIGITFLIVNIIVDIIASYLDPRIRLQGGDS